MVGLMAGKGVALATGKPFVAVNHLEAHALTARLIAGNGFSLSLSPGFRRAHPNSRRARASATTFASAPRWTTPIGEAFDKTAKLLGLAFPGGPAVEAAARRRRSRPRFALPRPMVGRPNADFSLSGLKTAMRLGGRGGAPLSVRATSPTSAPRSRQAIVDVVEDRMRMGLKLFRERLGIAPTAVVVAGGVAANAGSAPGARALLRRSRAADGRPAAEALHRQWRDDRLGRHRATAPRTERRARRAARPRWPLDPKSERALNNKA